MLSPPSTDPSYFSSSGLVVTFVIYLFQVDYSYRPGVREGGCRVRGGFVLVCFIPVRALFE